jgi:acyl-ACP thioesterase
MLLEPKLSKNYSIMARDVDFTQKIKLSAVFNYFQEVASLHSENLGMGFNTIEENYGLAWVLTRIKVDIDRYPIWNEEVIFETWPQYPKKFHFDRDYLIKDLSGNIIARAVSVWVILDIKTREIKKTDTLSTKFPEPLSERALSNQIEKIKPCSSTIPVYKKMIGCSDIDINGHLNNSRYVDFIMDCFTIEDLRKYHAKSIQINYINETLPGDTIILSRSIEDPSSDTIYIQGIRENNNDIIFRAFVQVALS